MIASYDVFLTIARPPLPQACFEGELAERALAYRNYELAMWTDAVECRGLRLDSLDPLDRIFVAGSIQRRREL